MLIVDIAGKGNEYYVYGLEAANFDQNSFLAEHEDDYMEFEEESHDSLFAIDGELIFSVDLNGETVIETNDGQIGKDIDAELLVNQSAESWREFSSVDSDEVAIIWGHSGVVGNMFCFNDVDEFDISKLKIYGQKRPEIDGEGEEVTFAGVSYDGKDPDDVQHDFVPKYGFWGPIIFLPN